jgi:hypothetical protein
LLLAVASGAALPFHNIAELIALANDTVALRNCAAVGGGFRLWFVVAGFAAVTVGHKDYLADFALRRAPCVRTTNWFAIDRIAIFNRRALFVGTNALLLCAVPNWGPIGALAASFAAYRAKHLFLFFKASGVVTPRTAFKPNFIALAGWLLRCKPPGAVSLHGRRYNSACGIWKVYV